MKLLFTKSFRKDYAVLSSDIQTLAEKKLKLLLQDSRHRDIWEGSITQNYRFTFQIIGDAYILRRLGTHDILRTP